MAMIFDFPTNYEEKLSKTDTYIDKGYIDQAICFLEDLLDENFTSQARYLFRKKLITCYMLKREYDTCVDLVNMLLNDPLCDLTVRAHDILVAEFEFGEEQKKLTQQKHENDLGSLSVYYRTLIELTSELKAYYQNFWFADVGNKVMKLCAAQSIEEKLYILSDLQEVEADALKGCEALILDYFEQEQPAITKTILYKLLIDRQIETTVTIKNGDEMKVLRTESARIHQLETEINKTLVYLEECYVLSEEEKEFLTHQLIFFYQYVFPFENEVSPRVGISELIKHLGLKSLEKSDILDLSLEEISIMSHTTRKVSQYILSLSSIL
ncbi:MAG: hypothetical protein ACRCST_02200 [Turicibacter sp.]